MRIRSRGPQGHRPHSIHMSQWLHTMLGLQVMFGSRRGLTAFVVLLVLFGFGYFIFQYFTNFDRSLEKADSLWDRDRHVEAIREYKSLLRKRDPLDPNVMAVYREDRIRLYRRIISHEVRYGNPAESRDWINQAYQEGIAFSRGDFQHEEVYEMWREVTEGTKKSGHQRILADEFLEREK